MSTAVRPEGRLRALAALLRPANIVTAWADVLAGAAIAHASGATPSAVSVAWLLLSTTGLYGGGVVLNDVFDADLDAVERPERPIPSGRVSRRTAAWIGAALLALGVAAAGAVGTVPALVAAGVAACALLYDARGKHHPLLGPLNMGLCRGGNLLLGASMALPLLGQRLWLGLLPVAYIAGVTAVSRGEVHGSARRAAAIALGLVASVQLFLFVLWLIDSAFVAARAVPAVLLFAVATLPAYVRAARTLLPADAGRAVRAGVLSLILLNTALAAGYAGWPLALGVLALLPLSIGLARLFAVT